MLRDSLPRQQFKQIIQGAVDGNILARQEIPPFRKDVLQKMSGGDRRRKDKLLEAQKKANPNLFLAQKLTFPKKLFFQ